MLASRKTRSVFSGNSERDAGSNLGSRCFGVFTTGGFPQISSGYTDPNNPAFERSYCDQDRRHLGVITVGYQTPTFGSVALRAIASDWRLSGILNARSGVPLNVIAGGDRAFSGITASR